MFLMNTLILLNSTSEWGSKRFQEEDSSLWGSVPDLGWGQGTRSQFHEDLQLWKESVSLSAWGAHPVQDCLLPDEPSSLSSKEKRTILWWIFSPGQFTCAAMVRVSTTQQADLVGTAGWLSVAGWWKLVKWNLLPPCKCQAVQQKVGGIYQLTWGDKSMIYFYQRCRPLLFCIDEKDPSLVVWTSWLRRTVETAQHIKGRQERYVGYFWLQ